MNRDALLASLIGFAIGLLITGLLLVAPNIVKNLPRISLPKISLTKSQPQTTPAPTSMPQTTFSIVSPIPDAIVSSSELLISGTATPNATVVLAGLNDEQVVIASGDGKFAGTITLSEGKNDVAVIQIIDGKQESLSVTVFFTKEDF